VQRTAGSKFTIGAGIGKQAGLVGTEFDLKTRHVLFVKYIILK
jgi:hypothetical protein